MTPAPTLMRHILIGLTTLAVLAFGTPAASALDAPRASDGADHAQIATVTNPCPRNLDAVHKTYAYDGFGEMSSATIGSGGTAVTTEFTRDALTRLAGWSTAGVSTTIAYAGPNDVPSALKTGTQTTELVRDPTGTLISARNGTAISHAATNTHGDLIAWRSPTAPLVTTTLYDPFGVPTTTPGPGVGPGTGLGIGYESHLTHPGTGLVDLGSRTYDPTTGRFTSQDVITGDLTSPVTLNRYTYANADPLNFTDPTGYFGWSDLVDAAKEAGSAIRDKASDGADVLGDVGSEVKDAITHYAPIVSNTVASAAVSTAQALQSGVSNAVDWTKAHKAEIVGVGVGIVVASGCMALTGPAGLMGCTAIAGTAAGLASNYLDPDADHSPTGYAVAGTTDGLASVLTMGVGRAAFPFLKAGLSKVAPQLQRLKILSGRSKDGIEKIANSVHPQPVTGAAETVASVVEAEARQVTVLGRYTGGVDAYVGKPGFNALDLPFKGTGRWNWTRNKRFIDDAIEGGDEIRLVTDPTQPLYRGGNTFQRELKYLQNRGYTWEQQGDYWNAIPR